MIEALAAGFGLAGSFMLASRRPWSAYGWLAFLASNAAWLVFAWAGGHRYLFAQQVGFTITSLLGIWQWLVKPRLFRSDWA